MSKDKLNFEPAFDFSSGGSSILLHKKPAKVCIDGMSYTGSCEVRLDLAPRAHILIYGEFQNVPSGVAVQAMIGQIEVTSFSVDGRDVDGFFMNIGGDGDKQIMTVKWYPKSEPINGVGEESTQIKLVVFHLFNFISRKLA